MYLIQAICFSKVRWFGHFNALWKKKSKCVSFFQSALPQCPFFLFLFFLVNWFPPFHRRQCKASSQMDRKFVALLYYNTCYTVLHYHLRKTTKQGNEDGRKKLSEHRIRWRSCVIFDWTTSDNFGPMIWIYRVTLTHNLVLLHKVNK